VTLVASAHERQEVTVSLRHPAVLAPLLAAAILGSASPALGAVTDPSGGPLAPDQAQLLASAPADVPDGFSTTAVDGATALKASTLPGADTSIEGGVSPQAAVGLADLSGTNADTDALPLTSASCWASAIWHQWGTWPYQQRVTDTTYWCAVVGNHITYRTSSTTASGLLCGVSWRASALVGGGVGAGFTYVTNRASAGFSCQTDIPWIAIHTSHYLDVKHTDRGVTTQVGTG
jgi:hypothetical protein